MLDPDSSPRRAGTRNAVTASSSGMRDEMEPQVKAGGIRRSGRAMAGWVDGDEMMMQTVAALRNARRRGHRPQEVMLVYARCYAACSPNLRGIVETTAARGVRVMMSTCCFLHTSPRGSLTPASPGRAGIGARNDHERGGGPRTRRTSPPADAAQEGSPTPSWQRDWRSSPSAAGGFDTLPGARRQSSSKAMVTRRF